MKNLFLSLLMLLSFNAFSQSAVMQITSATSGTVTCQDTKQDVVLIHDAGVTLSMTIAFPANPTDGQKVSFVSAGGITSLSLTTTTGTIINALTGMAAGSPATYIWSAANNKWYRIR